MSAGSVASTAMTRPRDGKCGGRVPDEVVQAISRLRAPVVLAHVVPDADALGSMLGLCRAWDGDGRRVRASLPRESLSKRLAFLSDWAQVPVATAQDFEQADGFIVVDTAKRSRCNVESALRDVDWAAGRPMINIDHHATNERFGTVNWIVGDAASACELVYEVLRAADRTICPITASLLYAGIQTDTLGFSLPSTSAMVLRAAADLVELGADIGELGERLARSQRRSEFELLRVVYDNTKVVDDGRIAYSSASFDEILDAGCTAADIDEQINVPRSLDGVCLAMLFSEGRKGKTRVNFRSSGEVTIVDLAKRFGGGGHSQAAGAILDLPLHEAMDRVVPAAIEHLQGFPSR